LDSPKETKVNKELKMAMLTRAQVERVRQLEAEIGTWIVAVEPEIKLAELTEEQLAKVREAEKELGVVLLAYEQR
jgi:hypothetical protein